jgi:hypothetical protein
MTIEIKRWQLSVSMTRLAKIMIFWYKPLSFLAFNLWLLCYLNCIKFFYAWMHYCVVYIKQGDNTRHAVFLVELDKLRTYNLGHWINLQRNIWVRKKNKLLLISARQNTVTVVFLSIKKKRSKAFWDETLR